LSYKVVKDVVITELYQGLEKVIVWRKLSPYSTYRRPQPPHVSFIIHREQFLSPPISQSKKKKKTRKNKKKQRRKEKK
jgi:hypothetical protein